MMEDPVSPHTKASNSLIFIMSDHTDSSILPEEARKNIDKSLRKGKLIEVVSVIRKTMEIASRTKVNIAVMGDSGNGISSFINALRDIGHEEENSAPTGVVRTTETQACYTSSLFPDVVLWDIPGMGATAQSIDNYLDGLKFTQYDLFIIIASEQCSMNHVKLAKILEGMRKKFYVVWTKLDRDISTSVLSEVQMQIIRDNIQENLQKEGVQNPPIFLVSSLDPFLHDFPKLRETLKTDLSNIRFSGLIETLSQVCEEIINDRVTSLTSGTATEGFQDISGIQDPDNLEEALKAYQSLFGVDNESLQQVAQSMGKPTAEYMDIVKSQEVQTYHQEGWTLSWVYYTTVFYFFTGLSYIPYCGDSVAHYLRYLKKRRLLESVAEDTMTILRKVLNDFII
ncbi:immunity-related GTPase family M protein 1-like [Castor canadensis]|uniref:Immunity-related GTPase family M protein 1-like n=3 Tax=Castor canadensis TaxID=51338 RepID=A0AC58L7Q4_CASCN